MTSSVSRTPTAAAEDRVGRPRLGLALGGGAARGFAHISMLEVFDEFGLRPDRIAGTSMGALVGAVYAAGVPAAEIRGHAIEVLGSGLTAARRLFGRGSGGLVSFPLFAAPMVNGEALTELIFPPGMPERIEDMSIPFTVTAADFYNAQELILSAGPVKQAVAASIAIPGIIAAPLINGRVLVDGGIINPLPVDHLWSDCDLTVAVDVTGRPLPGRRAYPGTAELFAGAAQIFTRQIISLRNAQRPPDLYIEPPVSAFRAHEFLKVRTILAAADRAKDGFRRDLEALLKRGSGA